MSKNNTVAIQINQDKLLANLEYSFTNQKTVLGELMQNARRAGATHVSFLMTKDSNLLIINDDGKGVDDFQNLFSVADSGWDATTVKNERPFGMGFLSCLYAAKHISVISNGYEIEGSTSDILAGKPLEVKPISNPDNLPQIHTYTMVSLADFAMSYDKVCIALKNLAYGFQIPVTLNGTLLASPQNIDSGKLFTHVDGIGSIALTSQGGKLEVNRYLNVYLQGLPVLVRYYSSRHDEVSENPHSNVVHLDPTKFFGRLPDRDKLTNEKESIEMIDKAINQLYLDKLIELKNTLDPKAFASVEIFKFALEIKGGLKVFCAEDVRLPNYFMGTIHPEQPSCSSDTPRLSRNESGYSYSLDDVKSGKVNICLVEDMESYEESNAAAWIFAKAKGWELLDVSHDHKETFEAHWVNQYAHRLNNDNITIEIIGEVEGKRGNIGLDYWDSNCEVVLCESYKLVYTDTQGNRHEAIINNEPLFTPNCELLVPAAVSDVSYAVMQGADYDDNGEYLEAEMERAGTALQLFVQTLRTGDEVSALQSHLNSLWLGEYSKYVGNTYQMTLDENCKIVLTKTVDHSVTTQ